MAGVLIKIEWVEARGLSLLSIYERNISVGSCILSSFHGLGMSRWNSSWNLSEQRCVALWMWNTRLVCSSSRLMDLLTVHALVPCVHPMQVYDARIEWRVDGMVINQFVHPKAGKIRYSTHRDVPTLSVDFIHERKTSVLRAYNFRSFAWRNCTF